MSGKRLSMDDFRSADGQVDWTAYREAQINAGEICYICRRYTLFTRTASPESGGPCKCADCKLLDSETSDVSHGSHARCPRCKHLFDVDNRELYEEREHQIECPKCDQSFAVEVSYSKSYRSPALLEVTR